MHIRLKINPKTGVVYLPRTLVQDGFRGTVDAFSLGTVLAIVRPGTSQDDARESLAMVSREMELTPKTGGG